MSGVLAKTQRAGSEALRRVFLRKGQPERAAAANRSAAPINVRWNSASYYPYNEGSDNFVEIYRGFESRIHVDPSTGHSRFLPTPPSELLTQFYASDYLPRDLATIAPEFSQPVIDTAVGLQKLAREISSFGSRFRTHDIGCGSGRLVWAFQQSGCPATGNEASVEACEAGNTFCNGALSPAPLAEVLAAIGEQVDFFTSMHVLEHLQHPEETLRTVKKHLSQNGLCYFVVPNGHSLQALMGGRRADPDYGFPVHLHYFTPKSFVTMLAEAGLEAVGVETMAIPHLEKRHAMSAIFGEADMVDSGQWTEAINANLLGYELRLIVAHPENSSVKRDPNLMNRVDRACSFFMNARASR